MTSLLRFPSRLLALVASIVLIFSWSGQARAQWTPPNPVNSFTQISDGLEVHQNSGVLRIQVTSAAILHITYGPESGVAEHPSDGVLAKRDWPDAAGRRSSTSVFHASHSGHLPCH